MHDDLKYRWTKKITCPYCGSTPYEECDQYLQNDGDTDELYCDDCEKVFDVEMHIDITWSSYEKDQTQLEPTNQSK